MITTFLTLVLLVAFFTFCSSTLIHSAYAQSVVQAHYNAHGITIDFPYNLGYPPMEQVTDSVTSVVLNFMFTDFGFGGGFETDPDGAVMSVQLFPVSTPIESIIPPLTLCQDTADRETVPINSVPSLKVAQTCNFGLSDEINEQYLIKGSDKIILIKYSAPDQFAYNQHYQEFIQSVATFRLLQ
jgi:hypothetical protein